MNTSELVRTLETLFSELVNGPPERGAFMLNSGDAGLLRSLDRLSAEAASAAPAGGPSIAANVEHLRYGLSLMNRWAAGEENPFADADWSAAWRRRAVSDAEWARLRAELRGEAERWLVALRTPREVRTVELNGMVGSIAHLAYHLGAIRQIDRATRGPSADD
ncbi:MAG TPA: DinB family protein [Longimicrobium sp.]|nr:DinB family protein [Longimicrobium sp.]